MSESLIDANIRNKTNPVVGHPNPERYSFRNADYPTIRLNTIPKDSNMFNKDIGNR